MNFKQLSSFNGVLDFFSIILPGFVVSLIFFMANWDTLTEKFLVEENFQTFYFNLVFLIISYVIGQALFQIGSLMDKLTYDRFRDLIYKKDSKLKIITDSRKWFFRTFNKSIADTEKDQFEHMNNFQWSLSYLRQNDNDGYQEVERIMADSKFFRSIFSATILYLIYYGVIHFPSLMSFIILGSCIIYAAFFYYEKWTRNKLTENKNKLTEEEKKLLKENNKSIIFYWLVTGVILFTISIIAFFLHNNQDRSEHWEDAPLMLELDYYYNPHIALISIIALLLYFRIRKKCIKKTYQLVLYNLKLNLSH